MSNNEFIPVSAPDLSGNEAKYVAEAVESTWVSSKGKFLSEFESMISKSIGVEHAIATSSGTTALHLALASLGIGPGHEVIVPSLTFVATANAVKYCGATPVFTDVSPDTWCIDRNAVEKVLSHRTKAVLPVHLFGNVADISEIRHSLIGKDIAIVEDAAEAQGGSINGKAAGSLGDVSCLSFYGNKIITTGEGGMLGTNSDVLAERARKLRDHGMDPKRPYWHDEIGFNYRMTNIQAAVGVAQMERFQEIISKRNEVFIWYRERLKSTEHVSLQPTPIDTQPAPWMFTVLLDESHVDSVRTHMMKSGVDTRPIFKPMHLLPIYQSSGDFHVSEDVAARGLCLPTYSGITESQVDRVCEVLLKAINCNS